MEINEAVNAVHANARDKGWWEGDVIDIPEKIALIHSEASEALEEYRNDQLLTDIAKTGKPTGMAVEPADIVIRVMDLCGALHINLDAEIQRKHRYNLSRSYRHGGKAC